MDVAVEELLGGATVRDARQRVGERQLVEIYADDFSGDVSWATSLTRSGTIAGTADR